MLIGFNFVGPVKNKCLATAGLMYFFTIGNTWLVDKMEISHVLLFFLRYIE